MSESVNPIARQDEAAVAAVRQGDAERYRELVERHERRVYAVAWSRLGDAALAEEVTQESFIRGYRRLWLLGDGAKFAGWISSIARRVAINLGLRHRRELHKRERWALENATSAPAGAGEDSADALRSPEGLQRTLGELPPAHRECLVLFYLEGKSGSEAAEALGISETALRVRLHRARAALRERLEENLEGSLAKLRPAKSLVPAIMAGVLAASSAQAAASGGIGATLLASLAKIAPFKWAVGLLPVLQALPVLLFSWLFYRAELRNYRDQTGFRTKILRRQSVRGFLWISVALVTILLVLRLTDATAVKERLFLGIGVFNLLAWSSLYQQAAVNRSRYQLTLVATTTLTTLCCFLVGAGWIPMVWFNLILGLQLLLGVWVRGERPIRMDYNLFLRASEGMLDPRGDQSSRVAAGEGNRLNKTEMLAFGRFLGAHWLADGLRWTPEGLELRLPPVDFRAWRRFGLFSSWSNQSTLRLNCEGGIVAKLSPRDHDSLRMLRGARGSVSAPGELEAAVASAVVSAWRLFRQNQDALAEATLGQVPESTVFVNSSAHQGTNRWPVRVALLVLGLAVLLLGKGKLKPTWLSGQNPVKPDRSEIQDVAAPR